MQILFLTPQLPYPLHQGTAIRNFGLIQGLSQRHQVSLLSFLEPDQSLDAAGPLLDLCQQVETVPAPAARSLTRRALDTLTHPQPDMGLRLLSPIFSRRLAGWLDKTSFDIIHFEGIEMSPYLDVARQHTTTRMPLLVFDDHNCEYLLQKRYTQIDARMPHRWPGALYSFIQWQKLRLYETRVCHSAHCVLAVSPNDAQGLRTLVPGLDVTVIPNGIDTSLYQSGDSPAPSRSLVFVGKMDFRPNVDAVEWFYDAIWPRIRRQVPDAHFYAVGQRPHARLAHLHSDTSVTLTGWVTDQTMHDHITQAAVYVIPLRMGSGTRLKLLEAMAMGKAIVATRLGAEGFAGSDHQLTTGKELVIVQDNDPTALADAVISLMRDAGRRAELGSAARTFVRTHYDWQTIIPRLEDVYARCLPQSRGVSGRR